MNRLSVHGCGARLRRRGLALMLGMLLGALPATAQDVPVEAASEAATPPAFAPIRIPAETLALLRRLPLQEGGRVKPFETHARVVLTRYAGSPRLRIPVGNETVTLEATEWLATCLLYPEWAVHYPTFRLDNPDVAVAIGVSPHASRRERYTYAELFPARQRLMEVARQFVGVERKNLTPAQRLIMGLAENMFSFENHIQHLAFARDRLDIESAHFPSVAASNVTLSISAYLAALSQVRQDVGGVDTESEEAKARLNAMAAHLAILRHYMQTAGALHLFPPAAPEASAWLAAGQWIERAFQPDASPRGITNLAMLEAVVAARDDAPALHQAIAVLVEAIDTARLARNEAPRLDWELALHRLNPFGKSQALYLLSFLALALTWLWGTPRRTGLRVADAVARLTSYGTLTVATVLLIAGIVMRCVIRGRPPVSTLYETLLFITAVAVLIAVALEVINRRRVAIALAPALGLLGMFLANKYELKEAVDTMPSLQAVLDTNFWLATHVTCITIGYAAALLAGAIAHLYVLGRVLRVREADTEAYAGIGRMVYGVVAFALFFSFIGTMLGGIWANYSWGRFWGWDPKENGALMIVLWQLIILHARMGGYVRDFGVAIMAIVGGCIVAFSWWGVNLLGVGLHSYGFTHGIWGALMLFWGIEVAVMTMGLIWRGGRRFVRDPAAGAGGGEAA